MKTTVAQAQHAVKELCDKLEENGAEVNFAIPPVAGRMPGHMNVLLAEANIPYEQLKTADEMNPQMSNVDVAIVIGANDVVNPDAIHDEKGRKMFDVSATRMSRCLEREKILRERSSRNDTDVEVCQSLTLTKPAQYSY